MGVAENIREARVAAGMTQSELADAVGKTRAAVTQWESGWVEPRLGTLGEIAAAVGTSVSALVGDGCVGDDEGRLVGIWRRLDREGRSALMTCAESLLVTHARKIGEGAGIRAA